MPTFKNRPLTKDEAPDTARVYERAKPEAEAGMGRLDTIKGTPTRGRDQILEASPNKHKSRQLNSEDTINSAGGPVKSANAPARKTRHDLAQEKRKIHRRRKS